MQTNTIRAAKKIAIRNGWTIVFDTQKKTIFFFVLLLTPTIQLNPFQFVCECIKNRFLKRTFNKTKKKNEFKVRRSFCLTCTAINIQIDDRFCCCSCGKLTDVSHFSRFFPLRLPLECVSILFFVGLEWWKCALGQTWKLKCTSKWKRKVVFFPWAFSYDSCVVYRNLLHLIDVNAIYFNF